MSRESPINVLHLYAATAAVLVGMGGMILVAGRWQGEVNTQLKGMTEQVMWLRTDIQRVAEKVQRGSEINAVQGQRLDQLDKLLPDNRVYVPPDRQFDR